MFYFLFKQFKKITWVDIQVCITGNLIRRKQLKRIFQNVTYRHVLEATIQGVL